MPIATTYIITLITVNLFMLIAVFLRVNKTINVYELEREASLRLYRAALEKIEALTTVPTAQQAPNEASKKPAKTQILDENVPWDIPKDVKIAVEGGDSNTPPEYEF